MSTHDLIPEHQQMMEVWRLEARARRAAKRVGLVAMKTRRRAGTLYNQGGFALFDPQFNFITFGEKFNLSPEDVIELPRPDNASLTWEHLP